MKTVTYALYKNKLLPRDQVLRLQLGLPAIDPDAVEAAPVVESTKALKDGKLVPKSQANDLDPSAQKADEEIEKELEALKATLSKKPAKAKKPTKAEKLAAEKEAKEKAEEVELARIAAEIEKMEADEEAAKLNTPPADAFKVSNA